MVGQVCPHICKCAMTRLTSGAALCPRLRLVCHASAFVQVLAQHRLAVASVEERLEFLHGGEMCAQPITQCVTEAFTRRTQRIQLKDELHPMPYRNAQGKHGIAGIQALHTAHRTERQSHTAPPPLVPLARKAQERGRERKAARVHQVLLRALLLRIRQRQDRGRDLRPDARCIGIRRLVIRQAKCLRKLLPTRRRAVIPEGVHNGRHTGRTRAAGAQACLHTTSAEG